MTIGSFAKSVLSSKKSFRRKIRWLKNYRTSWGACRWWGKGRNSMRKSLRNLRLLLHQQKSGKWSTFSWWNITRTSRTTTIWPWVRLTAFLYQAGSNNNTWITTEIARKTIHKAIQSPNRRSMGSRRNKSSRWTLTLTQMGVRVTPTHARAVFTRSSDKETDSRRCFSRSRTSPTGTQGARIIKTKNNRKETVSNSRGSNSISSNNFCSNKTIGAISRIRNQGFPMQGEEARDSATSQPSWMGRCLPSSKGSIDMEIQTLCFEQWAIKFV